MMCSDSSSRLLEEQAPRKIVKQPVSQFGDAYSVFVEGLSRQAGGEPFKEKMVRLTTALRKQTAQSAKLDQIIWANLACLCESARRQEDIGHGR